MKVAWQSSYLGSPLLFSRSAEWPGISLRHWKVRNGEMPESSFPQHTVTVLLGGAGTTLKQSTAGVRRVIARGAGSLCLVPSGQPISMQIQSEIECISMFVDPTLLERTASDAFYPGRVELLELEGKDPLIQQIGLALLKEAEADIPAGRLYVDSLVNTLSLHLLHHYTVNTRQTPRFNGGLSGLRLRRTQEYIAAHLDEDLTLDELAQAAGLSPFHFARAFKRTTGQTPQQYLWQQRIERARCLLVESDLPIAEVSLQTGFKNQSHFTTLFRKFTQMTPKAWRDAMAR